ncbi:multiple sugar transport system permease protein [Variovorax paradoxus]|uniref:carbohydrate ABC transporter permease n=1 Tax=Variovorax atrisoli TaxID=3394203 RepID=UPI001199C6A7|nr:sugar ABC transporter permease [Variovorax paradoxus]MDR6524267.1 multiple sugar transport system permease protein [Variovorax paradoxus]
MTLREKKKKTTRLPLVFIGPGLLVLAVLALVPTLFAIGISLQDRELGQADTAWVWLSNYAQLFSDRRFLNSVRVSLVWEVLTVSATMGLAVLLGVLMFQCTTARWRNVLSMLFIVPVLLPRVSAAFVWKFAFHPLFGLLTWPYKAITGEPLDLLASPVTALLTVAFVDVWQWGLFFAVIVLKLLETLPPQPFEAARMDHAKTWEVYAYVALPMLKAPLVSLCFVKMVESLRAFDLIYVMTRGGPGISTETLDMYAFSQGFIESGRISYASSMAVLMMVASTVAFTYIWKWTRPK